MKSFLLILGLFALMTQVFGFTCDPQACINGRCSNVGNGNSYCSCSGGYYGKNCDIAPQLCDASQGSCSSPANMNLVAHPTTCINFVVSNIPNPRPASTTLTIELFLRQNLPRNQAYTISQGTGGGTYVTYDFILPSLNTTQPNLYNGVLITDQMSDPYSFEIDRDVVGPVPRVRAIYPLSPLAVNGMLSICAYDYSYGEADTVFLDGATLHYYNLFDPCQSNPCLNGGVCVSNGASFTCDCSASGFSGNLCQGCLLLPNIGTFINSQTGGQAVVILSTQPTSTVTVYLEAECATLSKCSLTFTPQNWNSPQVITAFPSTNSTNDSGCRLRGKISSSDICDGDTSENFALVINEQMSSYYSRPPNSVAVSSGDPHFDTFDHVHHDFYDVGDFYFVRQLNGDFAIQTRQKPCNNVACNAAVAVKYKTAVFLLAIVDGAPSISSGNLLAEDVKVTGSDNTYTLNTPDGISVKMEVRYWFGTQFYMNIYVTAPESFHYQLVGLAGFYDGDRSNDLMMPDGQVTTVVNDFQQSWRVASAEDLFIDPSATIPALTSIFPTPAPTDAPTTAPTGPKGKTCTIPGADDVISKLPNTPPVSPVANETVPNNPDFEPPTCDFTDAQLEAAAKADCGAYFNDTVAQCCVSLGVNGDEQYAACLCDYKFAGNGDFIMDSVSPFYALCQQKATALNTTCDPCPRACSGHGTCGAGGICTCTTGFHGDDCGEDWSVPPTVATASPSSTSTCAVGAIVTVTGNNFFGTTGLTCLFNDVTTVAATKLTTFQVSCPLPSPRPVGAMTVKVSRDGMTSATGASFTLVESCCESPCAHGTCSDAANGGFTCDCTGTIYSGSRCETGPSNCPAESLNGVNWPSTAASASAIAPCPPGSSGSLSRACQATGTWGSVVDTCTPNPPCPAAADYAHASWPETQPGQAASGTCLTGYANGAAGAPRRQCPPNGVQFSSLVVNHCVRLQCPTVIEGGYTWNKTDSLLFIKLSCSLGQTGGPSRTCQGDGTWGPISGSCFTAATVCPVNSYSLASWPETPVGTVATGTCDAGYFGSPQRQCKQDGTWSSTLISFCQRRTCPSVSEGNAQWNVTNSLTTFYAKCDANYFGSPSRLCQADGTWGPITNPCALVAGTCPGQTYNRATWGATAAGATAFGTCIAGYTGTPNRICKADGTWQDLVRNLCTKI